MHESRFEYAFTTVAKWYNRQPLSSIMGKEAKHRSIPLAWARDPKGAIAE